MTRDAILVFMLRNEIPISRGAYLNLAQLEEHEMDAELEMELPRPLRIDEPHKIKSANRA